MIILTLRWKSFQKRIVVKISTIIRLLIYCSAITLAIIIALLDVNCAPRELVYAQKAANIYCSHYNGDHIMIQYRISFQMDDSSKAESFFKEAKIKRATEDSVAQPPLHISELLDAQELSRALILAAELGISISHETISETFEAVLKKRVTGEKSRKPVNLIDKGDEK